MSSRGPVSRIYVGNLPEGCNEKDVSREFEEFGKISKLDIKHTVSGAPYAFIEFLDSRDAEDAIRERNGFEYNGSRLRVEVPFNARENGRGGPRGYRGKGLPPRKGKYIVEVSGLPASGSWQDLKDHMREAGECGHADVFRDGTGEVSFFSRKHMIASIERFNGSTFRSHEGEKSRIAVREKVGGYSDSERGGRYHSRSRSHEFRRDYSYDRYNRRVVSRDRGDRRRGGRSESRSVERDSRRMRYSRSRSSSRSHGGKNYR